MSRDRSEAARRTAMNIATDELFQGEERALINDPEFREQVKKWFVMIHGEGSTIDIRTGKSSLSINYTLPPTPEQLERNRPWVPDTPNFTADADTEKDTTRTGNAAEGRKSNDILIIGTTPDRVASRRKEIVKGSPKLQTCSVHFVYAIEPYDVRGGESEISRAASFSEKLSITSIEEPLHTRAKASIEEYHPQLVLLYTGFIFRLFSEQVYAVLRRLRSEFPELCFGRFGTNITPADGAPPEVFDRDENTMEMERTFLEEISGGAS
jgi:hypothetical protein